MSGKTAGGSLLGLFVCVPQPTCNVDPPPGVRRARVLAGTEATVDGTLCVVAERRQTHAGAGSPSSAVAAGGRKPGCDRGAGVAAGERVVPKKPHGFYAFLAC